MNYNINTIIIAGITVVAFIILIFNFKKEVEPEEDAQEDDEFSLSYLCEGIKNQFNEIVNQNLTALYLSQKEIEKRKEQKNRLTLALRSSAQGNYGEKAYVIDYIKDLLQSKYNINEITINKVLPFGQPNLLTELDKYDILLQMYIKEYGFHAFDQLNKLCNFEAEKTNEFGVYYEVDGDDINQYYDRHSLPITYVLKLEVIAQRVFERTYGLGPVDATMYQKAIDGISAGNSGITNEQYNYMEEIMQTSDLTFPKFYESVWIILHGKSIHFSFLCFSSKSELIRVCKNLYIYDNVGHLTSSNGYKLSYLQNGSRVVVTRPKLTSGWAFFVRKFDSVKALDMKSLVIDDNNEIVCETVIWLVKGLANIIVSGDQGSGKTTFLKCMFQYIDQRYEIRTTEAEFELWLNTLYPNLSTVAFRSTEEVSLIDAINIQKKTNGTIMVLGEISDASQANACITLTQAGTKCTYGTCHTVSTEDLVDYFRNALLSKDGNFTNEMAAEEQVANSLNIDIHWEKTGDGHRYISYITEIIPYPRRNIEKGNDIKVIAEALKLFTRRRAFESREIIKFEHGRYVFKHPFSERIVDKIIKNLNKEEVKQFITFHRSVKKQLESEEKPIWIDKCL